MSRHSVVKRAKIRRTRSKMYWTDIHVERKAFRDKLERVLYLGSHFPIVGDTHRFAGAVFRALSKDGAQDA